MKPTHRLRVFHKDTSRGAEVGGGWQNPDGSITIKLNACVVLDANALGGYILTLFVADDGPPPREERTRKPNSHPKSEGHHQKLPRSVGINAQIARSMPGLSKRIITRLYDNDITLVAHLTVADEKELIEMGFDTAEVADIVEALAKVGQALSPSSGT